MFDLTLESPTVALAREKGKCDPRLARPQPRLLWGPRNRRNSSFVEDLGTTECEVSGMEKGNKRFSARPSFRVWVLGPLVLPFVLNPHSLQEGTETSHPVTTDAVSPLSGLITSSAL